MSFDTYANFQLEVADWLNRQDLVAKIPTFIQLAEAHMNRKLRVRQMITRAEATITDEYLALPVDFKALYDVQLLTDPITVLTYMAPGELHNYQRMNVPATPKYYTIVGPSLEFGAVPDNTYPIEIIYWATIPALAAPADSNWVLSEHPDLYLYTTLKQAAPYMQNDERIVTWGGLSDSIIEDLMVSDEKAVKGGVPLKARIKPYASGNY
jgi:hypothetical protein